MVQWHQLHFDQISSILQDLGATGNAAEGHGVLCGLLCAKGYVDGKSWVRQMVADETAQPSPPGCTGIEAMDAESLPPPLLDLHSETVRSINDSNYEFHLMLPNDEDGLELRVDALAQWCEGFLYGLGSGGIQDLSNLPEPVAEITQDLVEISKISPSSDGSDEDESAYTELVEYIRVGIQLIYEELQSTGASQRTKPTLH